MLTRIANRLLSFYRKYLYSFLFGNTANIETETAESERNFHYRRDGIEFNALVTPYTPTPAWLTVINQMRDSIRKQ